MATLTEANSWEAGIYQLELTDPVVGGADGLSNLQAKQLANRTLYLKTLVDALGTGKQPLDATLTALAGVVTAANQLIYATGPDAFSTSALSAFARTLLDDADAATARGTLGAQAEDATLTALAGVVTAANQLIYATGPDAFSTSALSAFARTLLDDADAATARGTLGAQAEDATLTALAGVVTAANQLIYATGADTFATTPLSAFIRTLLDDADAATARATLGISQVLLASLAEVQSGENNAKAVTPAGLMSLFSKRSFAADDYIRIPDVPGGLIVQWGTSASLAGSGSVTITLPIAYPNACLNVQCQRAGLTTGSTHGAVNGAIASASQIILRNGSTDTLKPMWMTFGY